MSNNQILVEQRINEAFAAQSQYEDKTAFFEYLASAKVMAQYGLDDDEVEAGVLGGACDGGIDSAYILCDEQILEEDADVDSAIRRSSKIEVVITQCKTSKSFTEDVFLKWKDACRDLLDFDTEIAGFSEKYSDQIIAVFGRIRDVISKAALKGASVKMRFLYIANAAKPSEGVVRQGDELVTFVESSVGAGAFKAEVELVGADRLMEIWFPPDETELHIKFSAAHAIVPERSDFFGLVALSDYYSFLVDESAKLRAYLFEANIRDYEGKVEVNKAIRETLDNPACEDFWWLNNGVTILAANAVQATGGVVRMEQPRIVNGLQTTYEIYSHMQQRASNTPDERKVMVRIIVPDDDATRSKVIMATNSQTRVKKTSLRATDPIHQQIEIYLKPHGLFYERRKNYYKNQGKRPEEIVSIAFLAQCLMSIILSQPDQARARPSTLLADDKKYKRLFRKNGNLEAYYKAAALGKAVVLRLPRIKSGYTRSQISDLRFYVLMGAAHLLSNKVEMDFADLAAVKLEALSDDLIGIAADESMAVYERLGGNSNVVKSSAMPNEVLKGILLHMRLPYLEDSGDQNNGIGCMDGSRSVESPVRKRRPPFKFGMLGIPAGSEIRFSGDENVSAITVDDGNKVLYQGREYSTSRLAAILNDNLEGSYCGPEWFTYNGELLSDMRIRIEQSAND